MNAERYRQLPSEYGSDDERDPDSIDTIVIHSMYNPKSETPFTAESCKAILDEYKVSAHYLIDRDGTAWQLIPENRMAWHAGKSRMPEPDKREKVNFFSIGIELISNESYGFTDAQYTALVPLIRDIMERCPIRNILGHEDITAGVRENPKTDPWNFDWDRFRSGIGQVNDLDPFLMIGPQSSG